MGRVRVKAAGEFLAELGVMSTEQRLQELMREFSDAPRDVVVVSIAMVTARPSIFDVVLESSSYPDSPDGEPPLFPSPIFYKNSTNEEKMVSMWMRWESEDKAARVAKRQTRQT